MKRLLILSIICLCALIPLASASPINFTNWATYGDAWKANNDTCSLVMYNSSGNHVWVADGNATTIFYLVQAAGGAGGNYNGGGGGAGGLSLGTGYSVSGNVNITVGSPGIGGLSTTANGASGTNSSLNNATPGDGINAKGGGGGAFTSSTGSAGGSGGGGARPAGAGGSGIAGQGNNGGAGGPASGEYGGGGGAGSGSNGVDGSASKGGDGGFCTNVSWQFGTGVGIGGNLSGGGGGSSDTTSNNYGLGRCGGAGNGGRSGQAPTQNATAGTGSGGGASQGTPLVAGSGASGLVVIGYVTNPVQSLAANFSSIPNPSTKGYPVIFTDTSAGNPVTWLWTFGDLAAGNTSTSQNPTRIYSTAGNYTVFLNTTNSTGSWSNYSHFQLVNPLSVGYVDDFSFMGTPASAKSVTIDPKSYTVTPAPGRSLWGVNLDVPTNSAGTFYVTQSNGNVVTGTWSYHYTIWPMCDMIATIGSSSSTMTFTNPTALPMKLQVWPSDNSTLGRGISLGYGQFNGVWNHVISEPVDESPITLFSYTSDSDVTIKGTDVSYQEAWEGMLRGVPVIGGTLADISEWLSRLKAMSNTLWGVVSSLWYWLDLLFIKNLTTTVVLYMTGTMAYAMFTSRNIFAFYKTWFKQQAALYRFAVEMFHTVVTIITSIATALKLI